MKNSLCVITPSYNQSRFIERTIDSVLAQNVERLEYIICDGSSTDGTIAILKRYGDRLRWISEKDRGQAHAVNKGIASTSAEIIGWLNSDDIYYPGSLRKVQELFNSMPSLDLIYGDAYHIDEKDEIVERYPSEEWDFERLKAVCYICQPATFFRRRIVSQAGDLDVSLQYCMDYEYWIRLAQSGATFLHIAEVLAGSRLHPESKTVGSRVRVHREINAMLKKRLGTVPSRWLFNYAHALIESRGLRRDHGLPFVLAVGALAVIASLRWNGNIPKESLWTIARWMR
jgi:glycosyltransferase involved in cell wall biosynthesis